MSWSATEKPIYLWLPNVMPLSSILENSNYPKHYMRAHRNCHNSTYFWTSNSNMEWHETRLSILLFAIFHNSCASKQTCYAPIMTNDNLLTLRISSAKNLYFSSILNLFTFIKKKRRKYSTIERRSQQFPNSFANSLHLKDKKKFTCMRKKKMCLLLSIPSLKRDLIFSKKICSDQEIIFLCGFEVMQLVACGSFQPDPVHGFTYLSPSL